VSFRQHFAWKNLKQKIIVCLIVCFGMTFFSQLLGALFVSFRRPLSSDLANSICFTLLWVFVVPILEEGLGDMPDTQHTLTPK
jgi:hypothetical protein